MATEHQKIQTEEIKKRPALRWWVWVLIIFGLFNATVAVLLGVRLVLIGRTTLVNSNQASRSVSDWSVIFSGIPQTVVTSDDPALGPETAPVTLVEFCDFSDEYCQSVFPVLRGVVSLYGDQLRLIYRDFPFDQNDVSVNLAEAAECAQDQGRFWIMHDRLYVNRGLATIEQVKNIAQAAGLDLKEFEACFDSDRYHQEVIDDYQAGLATGIRGVPTFFFNGYKVEGVLSEDNFYEILSLLLPDWDASGIGNEADTNINKELVQ